MSRAEIQLSSPPKRQVQEPCQSDSSEEALHGFDSQLATARSSLSCLPVLPAVIRFCCLLLTLYLLPTSEVVPCQYLDLRKQTSSARPEWSCRPRGEALGS